MLPAPLAVQDDPGEAEQVQPAPCKMAGTGSSTAAPVTTLGPALDTVIVYVTGCPGVAVVWPSVLAADRSATGVSASVSVAELLAGSGSTPPATVAVFARVPVAAGSMVAVRV
jgi:hypothetical protein